RARVRGTRACRPPDLRGPVPQRADPRPLSPPPPGNPTDAPGNPTDRSHNAPVTHSHPLRGAYGSAWDTLPAMDISGTQLRAVRAALFTAVVVTLSTASHVLLSKVPLPVMTVAAVAAAVFLLAFALAGRERDFGRIA